TSALPSAAPVRLMKARLRQGGSRPHPPPDRCARARRGHRQPPQQAGNRDRPPAGSAHRPGGGASPGKGRASGFGTCGARLLSCPQGWRRSGPWDIWAATRTPMSMTTMIPSKRTMSSQGLLRSISRMVRIRSEEGSRGHLGAGGGFVVDVEAELEGALEVLLPHPNEY